MEETKSLPVTKRMVWEAYQKVKSNRGSAGIDKQSISDFQLKLTKNLYKIWNRLTSGSYFPPPVKEVEIPKKDGKKRKLGIPTVGDRIAQTVVKDYLEPEIDKIFHKNSYGFRPKRSAHDALKEARKYCWKYNWMIDLDIKGFFDNIDHEKLLEILNFHTDQKWILMYTKRWLEAPIERANGKVIKKEGKGIRLRRGVISPLLANLFLHYAFDMWFTRQHPQLKFVRYADDIIVFCRTKEEAKDVLEAICKRLKRCKLEVHPDKTKIVYCKDDNRKGNYNCVSFDFLGYTFKPRMTKSNKNGKIFLSFDLAISINSRKRIVSEIRSINFHRWSNAEIGCIAKEVNPKLRSWIAYYGKYRISELHGVFRRINYRLVKWIRNRYKSLKYNLKGAYKKLSEFQQMQPSLFPHWVLGYLG